MAISPSATTAVTPTGTQAVATGRVLSIYQIIGLSFIDPRHGWLLASGPCLAHVCPATMRATQDGGATWAGLSAPAAEAGFFPANFPWHAGDPAGVNSIRFATAQDGWAYGPSLYSTHDGGQTWLNENRLVSDIAVSNSAIWAIEQVGARPVVERTTGAGQAWAPVKMQPLLIGWPSITSVGQETAWLFTRDSVLNPQLIVTNNGGNSWTELQPPALRCQTAVLKATSALFLWFICGGGPATDMQNKQVYTSSDGGISWQLRADSSPQNRSMSRITSMGILPSPEKNFAAPSASEAFIALDRWSLIMTKDGGRHWTEANPYSSLGGEPALGPVEFVNARAGWLAVSPNHLFRTTDGGHTWTDTVVP